jgi:nitrogen fixation NifU-like protein
MEMYIKVKNNRIEDIKLKTFGCGSAIATASMISELAKGKTIEEAEKITRQDVADELDGLPPVKMHCSNLASDALRDAIKNYHNKQKTKSQPSSVIKGVRKEIKGEKEFLGRGVFYHFNEESNHKDQRVMVVDSGEQSMRTALELTKHTPRVIFVTPLKEIEGQEELRVNLVQSNVKILYQSDVLEVRGLNEVEKVLVHNLDEDEEYELFIDSIIIL